MADFSEINQEINEQINTNGQRAITGAKLNEVLRDMISSVDENKMDVVEIDTVPTEGSTNPVESGGVYDALQGKQDTIADIAAIRSGAALGATALQSEQDPTVPSWAKQQTKPSYDYSEIGNTPDLSGFITNTVNNLTNYYLKSETYTKAEVEALIGAIQQFHYEFYQTLPSSGQSNVLYLIGPTGSGSDRYEEYVYTNNAFTKIGDTSIDLSGYVTTSALNTALADYTPSSNLAAVATSGSYNDLTNKPSIPDISGKADKVSNSTNGNLAGLDGNGNLTDSGIPSVDVSLQSSTPKIYFCQDIEQLTSEQVDALKLGDIVIIEEASYYGASYAYYVTFKDEYECNIDTPFNGESRQVTYSLNNSLWEYAGTEVLSLRDYLSKINSPIAGDFVAVSSIGNVYDSGKKASDFATASQGEKADTAYQKPSTGIPASDLASGVIPTVPVQDVTVGGTSVVSNGTAVIPQEVFWATYGTTTVAEVAAAVAAGKIVMCKRTVSNNPMKYLLTVEDGVYYCFACSQTDTLSWAYLRKTDNTWVGSNVTFEKVSDKTSTITGNETSTTKYPNTKAVADYAQTISNKVTSFQTTPDDTHYPSEKLVKDYVDGICGDIQTILISI